MCCCVLRGAAKAFFLGNGNILRTCSLFKLSRGGGSSQNTRWTRATIGAALFLPCKVLPYVYKVLPCKTNIFVHDEAPYNNPKHGRNASVVFAVSFYFYFCISK